MLTTYQVKRAPLNSEESIHLIPFLHVTSFKLITMCVCVFFFSLRVTVATDVKCSKKKKTDFSLM